MNEHEWEHNGDTCFCRKCGELENEGPCAVMSDEEKRDAGLAALCERVAGLGVSTTSTTTISG